MALLISGAVRKPLHWDEASTGGARRSRTPDPRGAADRSGAPVHSRAARASPAPEEPHDLEPPIHSAGAAATSTSTTSSGSDLHYPGVVDTSRGGFLEVKTHTRERTELESADQVRAWGVA